MSEQTLWAFPMGNPEQGGYDGMTLRDWFAGQAPVTMFDAAMACGLVALEGDRMSDPDYRAMIFAVLATIRGEYADAMLAARRTNSEGGGE